MSRLAALALVAVALAAAAPTFGATTPREPITVSITGIGTLYVGTVKVTCARTQYNNTPTPTCLKTVKVRQGAKVVVRAVPPAGAKLLWKAGCKATAVRCSLTITKPARAFVTFIPLGDRTNPVPLGKTFTLDEGWQLVVNSALPNADAQVAALVDSYGQPENRPPHAGAQYALVNVTMTYTGGGSSNLEEWLFIHDLNLEGAHNASYRYEACVPPSPDIDGSGSLFSGQSATGNLCYEIAQNDADSVMLTGYSEASGNVWFALR
jgi:hypothetical protein